MSVSHKKSGLSLNSEGVSKIISPCMLYDISINTYGGCFLWKVFWCQESKFQPESERVA